MKADVDVVRERKTQQLEDQIEEPAAQTPAQIPPTGVQQSNVQTPRYQTNPVPDSDGPGLATSAAIGGAGPAAVGAQARAGGSTSPSRVPAAPVAARGASTSGASGFSTLCAPLL